MVRFIEEKNDPFGNEENVLVGALVTGVALGKFMPNLYNKLFYQQNYAFFLSSFTMIIDIKIGKR